MSYVLVPLIGPGRSSLKPLSFTSLVQQTGSVPLFVGGGQVAASLLAPPGVAVKRPHDMMVVTTKVLRF